MRHRYAKSILAVFLLSAGVTPHAGAQSDVRSAIAELEGLKIAGIVFDPPQQPLEARDLQELLPIRRDGIYRAADVRTAIERMFASGRYKDIQVDASPSAGGVLVKFTTQNNWFIGGVNVDTDVSEPPSAGQMVGATHLQLGDLFDPAQMAAAIVNVRKLLADNGFFEPSIEPKYSYRDSSQQVDIVLAVQAGKRAHYATPLISGAEPAGAKPPAAAAPDARKTIVTAEELVKATSWRRFLLPGYRGVTLSRTRAGIDNIRLRYEKANRLLATVTLEGMDRDTVRNVAVPKISVDPGPEVTVTATGAKVSHKQLRQNVPIYEEHTVDDDLLAEGAVDLRAYFQAQGYFDAEVHLERQQVEDGKAQITYAVNRGARHRFVHLEIQGNRYFEAKTIRERMFLIPKTFEFPRGRYSEAFRRRDAATILDLYQSNGFRDAKVELRVMDRYAGREGDLAVFVEIAEGAQYRVSSLTVKGPAKLDVSRPVQTLASQKGQIFSEFNVAGDRETMMQYYGANGFPAAAFAWSSKPGAQPNTVDLEFVIEEGAQQFVREVVTSGLRTTRQRLVNRQLTLNPGSPLSPAAMAETQRKLDDLGIFAQVNMAVQNPDGVEDRKFVIYDLEEARRYTITTGLGAEFARIGGGTAISDLSNPGGGPGFSPRVSMNVTRLNFLGLGETLGLQGRLSTLQKRAVGTYFVPRIFNFVDFDSTFSLLYDDTHDVRTFESKREEAAAQMAQHMSKSLTFFYRFNYRHVGVSNLKIDPLLLPRLAQSVRVGSASFNLVQDHRDDPLDPRRGIYNTLDMALATSAFGSQTSFVRILGRNATYYKLGEKFVFARETQMGIQPAFSIPSNADLTDPIPLPERFYGGGGSTDRAFPENQAGPRDLLTGFPLGGSAMFFNSAELRFPLYGANVNGVFFEDAGNIFSSIGKMSFRTVQHSPSDFSYMVHAAGFGIRYRTPVGPIRVDLAYSINPPRFFGYPGSYNQLVQCSVNGPCQASLQQISHFQFFFSIGQAF